MFELVTARQSPKSCIFFRTTLVVVTLVLARLGSYPLQGDSCLPEDRLRIIAVALAVPAVPRFPAVGLENWGRDLIENERALRSTVAVQLESARWPHPAGYVSNHVRMSGRISGRI
jgi:hypothetical protein